MESPPSITFMTTLMRRHRHGRAGLTLVDVVVTMLIVGIVAAVAIPRYTDALMRYRVECAAKRIVQDVELARQNAKSTSISQSIQFTVATDSYLCGGLADINNPSQDYEVVLSEYPCQVSVNSVDLGGDTEIIFDGHGVPDSGGTIVVEAGGHQKTVNIDAETGKASVP